MGDREHEKLKAEGTGRGRVLGWEKGRVHGEINLLNYYINRDLLIEGDRD